MHTPLGRTARLARVMVAASRMARARGALNGRTWLMMVGDSEADYPDDDVYELGDDYEGDYDDAYDAEAADEPQDPDDEDQEE